MNSVSMASITAHYYLHLEEKRWHRLGYQTVPRATVVDPDRRPCDPLCTIDACPILLAFLSHDDTREVTPCIIPGRPPHPGGLGHLAAHLRANATRSQE